MQEKLRTTTAVRGRAYDVAAHQQAAMPEQLPGHQDAEADSVPDRQESEPRSAIDLTALRALKKSRTDVESLELTAERLRHLQDAFTEAADRAHATMDRYAHREDVPAPRPVREDDQRAHRPQQPAPRQGREDGCWRMGTYVPHGGPDPVAEHRGTGPADR
jgi:hypothetical protein